MSDMRNQVEFTFHAGMGEPPEDLQRNGPEEEEGTSGITETRMAEAATIEVFGKAELDPMCDCNPPVIYLQADCHPGAGFKVSYHKLGGIAAIWCRVCGEAVVNLRIL
jgi:hypothetical protein